MIVDEPLCQVLLPLSLGLPLPGVTTFINGGSPCQVLLILYITPITRAPPARCYWYFTWLLSLGAPPVRWNWYFTWLLSLGAPPAQWNWYFTWLLSLGAPPAQWNWSFTWLLTQGKKWGLDPSQSMTLSSCASAFGVSNTNIHIQYI